MNLPLNVLAKQLFQNILCLLFAGVLIYVFTGFAGRIYCSTVGGGCSAGLASANFAPLMGLIVSYFFFIPFSFSLFGSRGKHFWAAIFTAPVLLGLLYIDSRLPDLVPFLISGIAGLLAGVFANKSLKKIAPGVMAKIS